MPGPLITPPAWLDSSQKSVMDPLYIQLLRRAAGLFGGNSGDPGQDAIAAMTPNPLISIYKTPAERILATQAFRDAAERINPNIGAAADKFATKYPRVAAHIDLENPWRPKGGPPKGIAATGVPQGKVTTRVPIVVTPYGREATAADPQEAINTLFHEGTHVAQALGNSRANDLYGLSEQLYGYADNPMEWTARQGGNKAAYNQTLSKPDNALRMLEHRADLTLQGRYPLQHPQGAPVAKDIQGILTERAKQGWKPNPDYMMNMPKLGDTVRYTYLPTGMSGEALLDKPDMLQGFLDALKAGQYKVNNIVGGK